MIFGRLVVLVKRQLDSFMVIESGPLFLSYLMSFLKILQRTQMRINTLTGKLFVLRYAMWLIVAFVLEFAG